MPYKFTSKELDPETGLYYFGARYYDAQLSKWISTDPIFEKYLPKPADFDNDHDYYWHDKNDKYQKLRGMGGVYNPINNNLYCFTYNKPNNAVDPDGNEPHLIAMAVGAVYGAVSSAVSLYTASDGKATATDYLAVCTFGAATGSVVGLLAVTVPQASPLLIAAYESGLKSMVKQQLVNKNINAKDTIVDIGSSLLSRGTAGKAVSGMIKDKASATVGDYAKKYATQKLVQLNVDATISGAKKVWKDNNRNNEKKN